MSSRSAQPPMWWSGYSPRTPTRRWCPRSSSTWRPISWGENTKANGVNPAFRHSIFGGIAYCVCCGAAMCSGGSVYNGEREKYWYLVCNNLTSRDSPLEAASPRRALIS